MTIYKIWDKISNLGLETHTEKEYSLKCKMMNCFMFFIAFITSISVVATAFIDDWFIALALLVLVSIEILALYFSVKKQHKIGWHLVLIGNSLFVSVSPIIVGNLPTLSAFLLLYFLIAIFLFDERKIFVIYIVTFLVCTITFQVLYFSIVPFITLKMSMLSNISSMISLVFMAIILLDTYNREKIYQNTVFKANQDLLKEAQKIAHLGSWEYDYAQDRMVWTDQMFVMMEIEKQPFFKFEEVVEHFIPSRLKSIFLEALHKEEVYSKFNLKISTRVNHKNKTFRLIGRKIYDVANQKVIKATGIVQDITETIKKEEELAYSISLTKAALNSTTDGILIINSQQKVSGYNQKFMDLWKVTEKELETGDRTFIAKLLAQYLKNPNQILDKIALLYKTPNAVSFDLIEFKDGQLFELYSQPQKIKKNVVGRVWSFRDITAREKAKIKIEQHVKFLQRVLDSLPHPFFYKDETGKYALCNQAFINFVALPAEKILGKTVNDLETRIFTKEHIESDKIVLQSGDQIVYEVDLEREGTETKSVLIYKNVIKDNDGFHKGIVGTLVDITERKKVEKVIIDSEIRFRSLFEQSPLGIVIDTSNQHLSAVNKQFYKMLGYTKEELSEKTVADITHPSDRNKHKDLFQEVLNGTLDNVVMDKRYVRKDGGIVWAKVFLTIARDEQGKYKYDIAMIQDITAQKIQERKINSLLIELKKVNEALDSKVKIRTQELEHSNEELLRSNQDLEQFAYVASHDLQEPLRMVSNFVQLLDKRYGDKIGSEGKTYVSFAVQGAKRMSELIKNVLEYSRVGRQESNMRVVNLDKIVRSKLFTFSKKIEEKNIAVLINNIPQSIFCEPQLIGLVFQNLISNALKFNKQEQPNLEINCEEQTDFWQFSVRDNGIGIAPQYQQQIFEIFKRLHGQAEYEGTGIGLSLCKKIVLRHRGSIWLDSIPDHGTTFYFTINKNLQKNITSNAKALELEHS